METRYCYCCRTYHAADQLVLFDTKAGKRWRCLRSIEASRQPAAVRDSIGRQQSAENRAQTRERARQSLQLRHTSLAFA